MRFTDWHRRADRERADQAPTRRPTRPAITGLPPMARVPAAALAPRVQRERSCEVCGKRAAPSRHPCRFGRACSCWRGRPCSSRQVGQALAEFALITPLALAGLLGAADLGTAGLELAVLQGAAQTVADLSAQGLPADDQRIQDELLRCGCTLGYVMDDSPRVVVELSRHHVTFTTLLPDHLEATASAVMPAP